MSARRIVLDLSDTMFLPPASPVAMDADDVAVVECGEPLMEAMLEHLEYPGSTIARTNLLTQLRLFMQVNPNVSDYALRVMARLEQAS
jgi:hypothetical protein